MGTCIIFSESASVEGVTNLYFNQHIDFDVSEQDILSCPGFYTSGITDETCFPYDGEVTPPCEQKCADWQNRTVKTTGKITIGVSNYDVPYSVKKLKDGIARYGVLDIGYAPWRHAMALLGWETDPVDNAPVWIFKNSWGAGWGENGYARIKDPAGIDTFENLPSGVQTPITLARNPSLQTACVDKDNDTYCQWGISETKPSNCPSICQLVKDCNDIDPTALFYDEYFNCVYQGQPTPTRIPTQTPSPTITPFPTPTPTIEPYLSISPSNLLRIEVKPGTTVKIADIVSTGATSFQLDGDPIDYEPRIKWIPQSGSIQPGNLVPLSIQVDSTVPVDAIMGATERLINPANGGFYSFNVMISVIAVNPTPTPTIAPPPPPTNLTSSCPLPGNSIALGWSFALGAKYYAVRIDDLSNGWSGDCSQPYSGDFCINIDSHYSSTYSLTYYIGPGASGHSFAWWVHAVNYLEMWSPAAYGPNVTCPVLTPTSTSTPTLTPTPAPDLTPPTITITYPSNGSTITKNRTLNITATATDNVGVTKVEFYVNSVLKCTDTTSTYSCSWFVPNKTKVKYTIIAKAFDLAGNTKTHSITVTSK